MSFIRSGLLAATALVAISTVAFAADMRPLLKAPPMAPPAWSWTGAYIGFHAGAAWGTSGAAVTRASSDIDETFGLPDAIGGGDVTLEPAELSGFNIPLAQVQENGFVFGGQAGYNLQAGMWVVGIEGDISGTNLKGTAPCILVLTCSAESDWLATLAARAGVTYDRALFYLKGGAAFADVKYGAALNLGTLINASASVSDTRIGWMIGTGVEYAVSQNVSAKIEYNYLDFGTRGYTFNLPVVPVSLGVDIDQKIHIMKAGLNYHLGGM